MCANFFILLVTLKMMKYVVYTPQGRLRLRLCYAFEQSMVERMMLLSSTSLVLVVGGVWLANPFCGNINFHTLIFPGSHPSRNFVRNLAKKLG